LDLDMLADQVLVETFKYPGSFVCRALAGLDTAIWDLRGQLEGKSVSELLGGTPCALAPYGSSMSREITPKKEAERLARLRDDFGYRSFKIRVGKENGHDEDEWSGRTEALVPAVRRAVGDEIDLKVDANSCYTPPKAIEVSRLLEDNGVSHFEEPCPYWELDWTAAVTRATSLSVAGGEQDYDLKQWERMTAAHVMDIAQPDVCYIGGITRAMRAAKLAAKAGMPFVPHSANLSLVTVFTMHLLAATPNRGPHFEFCIEEEPWFEDLYTPTLQVSDGRVRIPEGPGWGVTMNEAWLANTEHRCTELERR
jgi:L-alanine-DL-glutamate epimerase-like enolase superfamily enzyme